MNKQKILIKNMISHSKKKNFKYNAPFQCFKKHIQHTRDINNIYNYNKRTYMEGKNCEQ